MTRKELLWLKQHAYIVMQGRVVGKAMTMTEASAQVLAKFINEMPLSDEQEQKHVQ
jgi:hypothetical protein